MKLIVKKHWGLTFRLSANKMQLLAFLIHSVLASVLMPHHASASGQHEIKESVLDSPSGNLGLSLTLAADSDCVFRQTFNLFRHLLPYM